jgi:hypothetical protein
MPTPPIPTTKVWLLNLMTDYIQITDIHNCVQFNEFLTYTFY